MQAKGIPERRPSGLCDCFREKLTQTDDTGGIDNQLFLLGREAEGL